jgi:DNA-binding NtrC family response regulator
LRLLWLKSVYPTVREQKQLEDRHHQISVVSSASELSEVTAGNTFDAVVCCLPQAEGAKTHEVLTAVAGRMRVLFYDPRGSLENASLDGALRQSLVLKSLSPEEILAAAGRLTQVKPQSSSKSAGWKQLLVGQSDAIRTIVDTIELIASRRATVLITGETGTGKDVVARAIHLAGSRASAPFAAVNCGAIPPALIESELFGHVKGAFTGAIANKTGRFEEADSGTLFLDEIAEIPIELQPKLLRAIQEREIRKVGSSESTAVNIRLLAATNQDLALAIRQRRFRDDLFYRINVVSLHIPALRERLCDIPPLVEHFMEKICRQEELAPKILASGVMDHLMSHSWPGNVRELEHCVEKAVALSGDRQCLEASDFPLPVPASLAPQGSIELPGEGLDFSEFIDNIQRHLLIQALQRSAGNKARAAALLGMKRSTLLSKVKALSAVCA